MSYEGGPVIRVKRRVPTPGPQGEGSPPSATRLSGAQELPGYESPGAAGMDMRAFIENEITISPLERVKIPTGLFFEIPRGFEAQIRPRSGLAAKYGVTVLNSPGTIDSDYRGEVEILLINLGSEPFTVKNGDRIAQMVIAPVSRASLSEAEFLSETGRGAGGFGSTGL